MGKRSISQEAAKTSKTKIVENKTKLQLNSLIKVLRPKVYITDSSSFKKLVQELTGNINTNTCLISDDDRSPEIPQDMPVFDDRGSPEQQSGKDSSVDSLLGFYDVTGCDQEIAMPEGIYSDGLVLEDDHQFHHMLVLEQQMEAEQYYFPPCVGYSGQEVSLFEFNEFSAAGIL